MNGEPSSPRGQHCSRMKNASFCFFKNCASNMKTIHLFIRGLCCHLVVTVPHRLGQFCLAFPFWDWEFWPKPFNSVATNFATWLKTSGQYFNRVTIVATIVIRISQNVLQTIPNTILGAKMLQLIVITIVARLQYRPLGSLSLLFLVLLSLVLDWFK